MHKGGKAYEIMHIFNDPKFSKPFFGFLIKHGVKLDSHFLFHYRCVFNRCDSFGMEHIFAKNFFSLWANIRMLLPLFRSEKIIIHGLASPFLLVYLCIFPGLLKKCYWVIWGKDLYFYRLLKEKHFYHSVYEYFRRKVIKEVPHIVTYTRGDYELAVEWYGSKAKWHKCFMYPSNLFKPLDIPEKNSETITVLVGNSADPSNNHFDAFEVLEKYKDCRIKVVVPLSYGDKRYARSVIARGREMFGDKFIPLEHLLPHDEYYRLLGNVDIAIFAHRRQQAMGNIITLLGLGKKICMRSDISSWNELEAMGVSLCDIDSFDLDCLDAELSSENARIIEQTYSEQNLLDQWREIASSEL